MSHVYMTNSGSVLGVEGGRFILRSKDGLVRRIPIETVESISVFGNSSITTPCIQRLLEKKIPVCYFSSRGKYFGRLEANDVEKVEMMTCQFRQLTDRDEKLSIAKRIVFAKINNQIVILRRYTHGDEKYQTQIQFLQRMKASIERAENNETLMGYEGMAARAYFDCISRFINPDFSFKGRTRRPPKDEFNSLLSLGYTLLLHEIISKLHIEGLSPYFGILHHERNYNPAFASDLMEEWRAVLVDSLVLSLIQGKEIKKEHFFQYEDEEGIYLTNEGMKIFLNKYERKMTGEIKYLAYGDESYSFREAINIQCKKISTAIRKNDFALYMPILLR